MTDSSVDTLARTIWGEARNQGTIGMQAVACVVMNRVAKGGWWGNTVEEVCSHPYQFSCWNSNDPNLLKLKEVNDSDPIFVKCLQISQDAIDGKIDDLTNGATSYKVIGTHASWDPNDDLVPCASIKDHVFYKDV